MTNHERAQYITEVLYRTIKHGDPQHEKWLKETLEESVDFIEDMLDHVANENYFQGSRDKVKGSSWLRRFWER